jgi:acetoin utilization protein AcuB
MIVSEVMITKLVLVGANATLSHAANLMREHQIHHLPVIQMPRSASFWFPGAILDVDGREPETLPVLEGLLTSHDIDIAVAVDAENAGNRDHRPWPERHVAEAMHPAPISVGPTSSVAAAAQLLVERGINCLPVVEYIEVEKNEQAPESTDLRNAEAVPPGVDEGLAGTPSLSGGQVTRDGGTDKAEVRTVLVGLLTRSDLLMALARSMGAFQPGIEVHILLPDGDMTPLAKLLLVAAELHIQVRSILAGPLKGPVPYRAAVQLGTIHPAPLLLRLQKAGIRYEFADFPQEHETYV